MYLYIYKIVKLTRYIDNIKELFPGNETLFTLCSFVVFLTMSGHLIACLWHATIYMSDGVLF